MCEAHYRDMTKKIKWPTHEERMRYLEDAIYDFPVLCMRIGNLRMMALLEDEEWVKKMKARRKRC